MTYLNGTNECNCEKKGLGSLKSFFQKEVAKAKHITDEARELHKRIIEKNKELARKVGAGVKRFAHIKKEVEFKAFIYALKHNVGDLAIRLKVEYKTHPNDVKNLLSQFGDWEKIKDAINAGDKHNRMKQISGMGDDAGMDAGMDAGAGSGSGSSGGGNAGQYAEYAKASVGIIQKIIEWFKKRKKDKQGDDKMVQDMQNSVNADSTIPKTDENGKVLPAVKDDANAMHEGHYTAGMGTIGKVLLIGAGVGVLAYALKNR